MLFAGFSVSKGELTLFGIVAAGVLGNLAGSWIAYAVGYYGRLDLLEKNKLIHVSPKHLKWADDWFERYGDADRLLLPHAADHPHLHLAAGRGREDALLALHRSSPSPARSPGSLALALIGEAVGDNWEDWRHKLGYLDYVVAGGDRRRRRLPDRQAAARRRPGRGRGRRAPRERRPQRRLSQAGEGGIPRRARVALGIVQGPAELLPVSSSAHIVLVPWLAGWDWEAIDPEVRKSFEVALHTGAAAALLIGQRRVIAEELRQFDAPPGAAAGALLPAGGGRRLRLGAADRAAARRPAGDRLRPARRRRGDARSPTPGRSGAAAARRPRPTGSPSASPRRRRSPRASRATASPSPRRAGAASRATRRTCSRARSRCRSSSAPPR